MGVVLRRKVIHTYIVDQLESAQMMVPMAISSGVDKNRTCSSAFSMYTIWEF